MEITIDNILQHNQARREHILNQIDDTLLSKAISQTDFNDKYGTEHEVYSAQGLSKYINDVVEKEGANDEIIKALAEELKTLSPVLIKGHDDKGSTTYANMYVRPMATEANQEEEDSEKAEEGTDA